MKKENITIESYKDEFILLLEKTMSLKNSIEKEINQINTLYDKLMKKFQNLLKEDMKF